MKKRKAKSSSEDKYNTISITMELERPLLYNDEKNTEDKKPTKEELSKLNRKRIITLLTVLILFVIVFFIWLSNGYSLQQSDKGYLQSDSKVDVTMDGEYTCFSPKNVNAKKGFIFYPGERVDSSSYAKLSKKIASYGYKVITVDMPLNYAKFGQNKANEVMKNNPDIKKWVIGGDSLGGTIACEYAAENKNVEGIVLISSYPTNNISELGFDVLSIWGSKDNIVNYKELIDSKSKLPKDTKYVQIEGANHSQFASYGSRSGDGEALISSDKQIDITVNNIVNFLYNIQ